MAGTNLLIVNPYDMAGVDTTTRSTIVEGSIIPAAVASPVILITSWSIAANVLTFTANNSLTVGGGQSISVSGFPSALSFLNGNFTTSSATATTIVVPLTHANASGPDDGLAVLAATYVIGGLPISYAFLNLQGKSSPVGTIGPRTLPKWIEVQSAIGGGTGALAPQPSYLVNTSVVPNLLRIYSSGAEAAVGVIVPDVVVFRAEFVKNNY